MLRTVITAAVMVICTISRPCLAQTQSGDCNTSIGANNRGQVNITCTGLPVELAEHIARLVNLLLSQKGQTSDIIGKLDSLYRTLSEMNARSKVERLTLLQRISDRRHQCAEIEPNLAINVERREQPSSEIYTVVSVDNDSTAQLRDGLGADGAAAFREIQTARRSLQEALGRYSNAAASLSGIEAALKAMAHLPPWTLSQSRQQASDLRKELIGLARKVNESFSGFCRTLKDVEIACTSDLCTK